jgi:hypothetical protein
MISRIFSLGGYHAAKLKNYQQVMDVMFESFNQGRIPTGLLNMLNAKYYVSFMPLWPDERSPLSIAWQEGSNRIYENAQALPRAFLVDSISVVSSDVALRTLVSPEFDPARVALMERRPDVEPVSLEGSSVTITEYGLNEIALRARIVQPCMLVLSEIAYPDWRAEIDGREAEILTANYCLRALPLTAGEHEIRFTFYSEVLRRSLVISLAVFAVVVAVPFVYRLILGRRG